VPFLSNAWAAMIASDDALPPEPGHLKGVTFFGASAEEAEREILAYLGASEPEN